MFLNLSSLSSRTIYSRSPCLIKNLYLSTKAVESGRDFEESEFRTLDLIKSRQRDNRRQLKKRWERKEVLPPRYKKMPVDQDWASVWPVARSFHPASVPLPLHQGYVPSHIAAPGKYGNLELMKIPNFLHLTPPAVQRHCEALKKFCTPWPSELSTEKEIQEAFPLEIISSDYLHSSPSVRDNRSRLVTVRIHLTDLKLDEHAKDKFLRLVGNRYDIPSNYVTFVIDVCPLRKQNFDYAMYLLAALFHESHNVEAWEREKSRDDMEKYIWDGSPSQEALLKIVNKVPALRDVKKETLASVEQVQDYSTATATLHNRGESREILEEYGKAIRNLFNLPKLSSPQHH